MKEKELKQIASIHEELRRLPVKKQEEIYYISSGMRIAANLAAKPII